MATSTTATTADGTSIPEYTTSRTFPAQCKEVYFGKAQKTKLYGLTREQIYKKRDGTITSRIPRFPVSSVLDENGKPKKMSHARRYRQVFTGKALQTSRGGLLKEDLVENSAGRIVSKKASENAKSRGAFGQAWRMAVRQACQEILGTEKSTFIIPKKGTDIYNRAIAIKEVLEKTTAEQQDAPEPKPEPEAEPEAEAEAGAEKTTNATEEEASGAAASKPKKAPAKRKRKTAAAPKTKTKKKKPTASKPNNKNKKKKK